MLNKDYLPAISNYTKKLAESLSIKKSLGVNTTYELELLIKISDGLQNAYDTKINLEKVLEHTKDIKDCTELSMYYREKVLPLMEEARDIIDSIEVDMDRKYWPVPSYGDLLYSVK
jgi:glutamine synthetase